MDTFLAIASRREDRNYADRPIPEEVERRILDAGRVAGSSQNKQQWRFDVVQSRELVEQLADAVWAPENVRGAQLVVAIVVSGKGPLAFDAGRAAQSMLLEAWNEGVGGCPNGVRDADQAAGLLGLADEETIAIILSFGYPISPRNVERHSAEEWSARRDRRPLDELVRRL